MAPRPNRRRALALMGTSTAPRPAQIRLHGAFGAPDIRGRQIPVNSIMAKITMAGPNTPIEIDVDSIGGSLLAAERLAAVIAAHPAPTTATVSGDCMSAATVIVLACRRRQAKPNAKFLIHSSAAPGARQTATWHRSTADLLDRADSRILDLYVRKTTASRTTLRRLMAGDKQFGADRALALGFIDRITGQPKKARNNLNARIDSLMSKAMARGLIAPGMPIGMEPAALARRLETMLKEAPR